MTRVYPDNIVEKYWSIAQRKIDMTKTDILAIKDVNTVNASIRLLDLIDFLTERLECIAVNIHEPNFEGVP